MDPRASSEKAEELFGQPADENGRPRAHSDINQGKPPVGTVGGSQGGDIDYEDGSGWTGPTHTEGPEDVDFGVGGAPLVGMNEGDEEEEDEEDTEDDAE
jgi:hypothetical protein